MYKEKNMIIIITDFGGSYCRRCFKVVNMQKKKSPEKTNKTIEISEYYI